LAKTKSISPSISSEDLTDLLSPRKDGCKCGYPLLSIEQEIAWQATVMELKTLRADHRVYEVFVFLTRLPIDQCSARKAAVHGVNQVPT
jgi:hypothetical protein